MTNSSLMKVKSIAECSPGIFFGCLRGRYKAPVPMANAYIFSQFEQKNSQSEGHFYVNQYSLQIAFIFN